jgi:hypothetical protein
MQKRRLLAFALAGALSGCYPEPSPEDSLDADISEEPGPDSSSSETPSPGTGKPDFQLESLRGPASLSTTSSKLLRAMACNRGGSPNSTEVAFFLSRDTLLDESDEWVATSTPVPLSPESCLEVSAHVGSHIAHTIPARSYFLIAVVDPDNQLPEQVETNNQRLGSSIRVDFNPPPAPILSWLPNGGAARPPRLVARSEANAIIRVYLGNSCAGEPVAQGQSTWGSYYDHFPIDVPSSYPASSYSARAYDDAYEGNGSVCSTIGPPPE